MLSVVSSILLTLGPLLGVALGALLPAIAARRALVRSRYEAASADISHLLAASTIQKTAYIDGAPHELASQALLERMLEAQVDALLNVRRSLALLAVHSPTATGLLDDVALLQDRACARQALAALQREQDAGTLLRRLVRS